MSELEVKKNVHFVGKVRTNDKDILLRLFEVFSSWIRLKSAVKVQGDFLEILNSSSLQKLNPVFIEGVMRVNGRLE